MKTRHPNEVFSNLPTDRLSAEQQLEHSQRQLRCAQRDVLDAKMMVLAWEDRVAEIENVIANARRLELEYEKHNSPARTTP